MKTYVVGGAVRDHLLGLPVSDRDHVVIGQTPEALLHAGFIQVGRDFPVFLHPETREEYALARTERKTGPGYRGFVCHASPEVSLEEDLARRDLTINAMAMTEDGHIIDPFGGQQDLKNKVLRHVGPAFVEDPLRVLRLARFAARFSAFRVAPETEALAKALVAEGELGHLVAERVWQEWARGVMSDHPERMIEVLQACNAWPVLFPELNPLPEHSLARLARATRAKAALPIRCAAFVSGLWEHAGPHAVEKAHAVMARLKAPKDCADLAVQVLRVFPHWTALWETEETPSAQALLDLLMACDGFRRPSRCQAIVTVFFYALSDTALAHDESTWPPGRTVLTALAHASALDLAAIARAQSCPQAIAAAVCAARHAAIAKTLLMGTTTHP